MIVTVMCMHESYCIQLMLHFNAHDLYLLLKMFYQFVSIYLSACCLNFTLTAFRYGAIKDSALYVFVLIAYIIISSQSEN